MTPLEFTDRATQMLMDIVDKYALYGGSRASEKLIHSLHKRCERLCLFPESGYPHHLLMGRSLFYRAIKLDNRIEMIYYYDGEKVYVVSFWDMRRNPDILLEELI